MASSAATVQTADISPQEARQIAKEAYIYGFPLVTNYETLHKQALDTTGHDYRAPFNAIASLANVATPEDKFVVTPNSDTPYSFLWMDLRAEPIVVTMPKVEKSRYYSGQLIDLYTFNFAYIGTRVYGNDGGDFLVAGPDWSGDTPGGIKAVLHSETEFVYLLFRTQLFDPDDLGNVKNIQAGYKAQPLSKFLGGAQPNPVPPVNWPAPTPDMLASPALFSYLNFMLQFCPINLSEKDLMERFAKLNIGAGNTFDFANLSPELQKAVTDGIADVGQDVGAIMKRVNAGEITSSDLFGTREFLKNNYLYRFVGAKLGLYGNSGEEAIYPPYFVDARHQPLNAAKTRYTLLFPKDQLPAAKAFWSLTMYDGKTQFLVANPLKRYLLNSTMVKSFKYGADGSLTLYVQKDSPGAAEQSNWLPAPDGPFYAILRIYMPAIEVQNGTWKKPEMVSVPSNEGAEKMKTTSTQPKLSESGVEVTPETYIRAETDRQFGNVDKMAGGVNRLFHFRHPTPLDKQNIVRMNRDTLYSMAAVDTSKGATITVPELPKNRYVSVFLVDNDMYCPFVIYTAGTHELPKDTKYLGIGIRIQIFNPKDADEVALVNKLQDQFVIKANSADPLPEFRWDLQSLKALTAQYEKDSAQYSSWKGMMGPRGKVDEKTRHIAVAAAWGLFPEWDATYLNYNPGLDPKVCYKATYQVPENKAFWSITVYGNDGYMKSENNIVNSSNAKMNADGTFTVYYGSKEACGDIPNRLDVTDGWNFLMRIYRPGPSVLDGSYKLPNATEVLGVP